jgi:hypothetical protein
MLVLGKRRYRPKPRRTARHHITRIRFAVATVVFVSLKIPFLARSLFIASAAAVRRTPRSGPLRPGRYRRLDSRHCSTRQRLPIAMQGPRVPPCCHPKYCLRALARRAWRATPVCGGGTSHDRMAQTNRGQRCSAPIPNTSPCLGQSTSPGTSRTSRETAKDPVGPHPRNSSEGSAMPHRRASATSSVVRRIPRGRNTSCCMSTGNGWPDTRSRTAASRT